MRLCEPLLSNRTPPERFTRHPRPRQCGVLSSLGFESVRLILYLRQLSDGPPVSCLVGGAASRLLFFQPKRQPDVEVHLKFSSGPGILQNGHKPRGTWAVGVIYFYR